VVGSLKNGKRALALGAPATRRRPGIGEKKRAGCGERFTAEIARYLETNPRIAFE
jgi:hypothetical protein